jgi:hypothetical protein
MQQPSRQRHCTGEQREKGAVLMNRFVLPQHTPLVKLSNSTAPLEKRGRMATENSQVADMTNLRARLP